MFSSIRLALRPLFPARLLLGALILTACAGPLASRPAPSASLRAGAQHTPGEPVLAAGGPMPDMSTLVSQVPPVTVGPTVAATPTLVLVDNRDPGFQTTGTWAVAATPYAYGGDCAWAPRGVQNVATFGLDLPAAGVYTVEAWWCGDPNHDQTQQAAFVIADQPGDPAPQTVVVNLQTDPGMWHNLGDYLLHPGAVVQVLGTLGGNVVADAVRLTWRGATAPEARPTPTPTPFPWTNHPPSPVEQLTAGDLTARLGIVQPRFTYAHTPVLDTTEVTWDDCADFPRGDCMDGPRAGWRVRVGYQELVVTYRVAQDFRHVAIEPNPELAARQTLFLYASRGDKYLRLDRYNDPVAPWSVGVAYHDGRAALHQWLAPEEQRFILDLAQRYGPVTLAPGADGPAVSLYGFGPQVALSPEDGAQLAALAASLLDQLP